MTKEQIMSDVFYIIKNHVCADCGAKGTSECITHMSRCNKSYWQQANKITDYFLKQPFKDLQVQHGNKKEN